ncbi:hypothetical protein ABID16_001023 [Rhizobium aquaticum]|uniref:Uncharacterized protein n=1 Tax=Rhizobium aquaticum TaxID=1549636 RepID=A0ABV2IW59_9HYPH
MQTSNTITIELVGSFVARHVESGTTVDMSSRKNRRTTKSAIPPLCRELLNHGHDPETRVHVIRKALDRDGFIPVFVRNRALSTWAGLDCIESDRHGPRFGKHRPLPDAVMTKKARSVIGTTNDDPENCREKIALTASERTQVAA